MKLLLILLTFFIFFTACNQENELDGLWYAAYKQSENGEPEPLYEKLLLDIKNDSCYTIRIGNLATGDLDEIIVESHYYDKNNNLIHFDYRSFNISFKGDSLTLVPDGKIDSLEILNKIVLRKLDSKFKNLNCHESSFKGEFVITGKNYVDSIEFINDSILINPSEFNYSFPVFDWEIINYQGFKFFYIHDERFPLTLLNFCSKDSTVLEYPYRKDLKLTLKPIKNKEYNALNIIGQWVEIQDSIPKPFMPPGQQWDENYYHKLTFDNDSVKIVFLKTEQKFKWYTSNSGKRIYLFNEKKWNTKSWEIFEQNKDSLTFLIKNKEGEIEDMIRLKRR